MISFLCPHYMTRGSLNGAGILASSQEFLSLCTIPLCISIAPFARKSQLKFRQLTCVRIEKLQARTDKFETIYHTSFAQTPISSKVLVLSGSFHSPKRKS